MNELLNIEIFQLLGHMDELAITWILSLTLTDFLQWLGCITGVSGAYLLACNNSKSGWGFALFLISNGFWIAIAILAELPGMLVQQLAFTITSALGVYRWLWIQKPDTAEPRTTDNCRECSAFAEIYANGDEIHAFNMLNANNDLRA